MTKEEEFLRDIFETMNASINNDDPRKYDTMWAEQNENDKANAVKFAQMMIGKGWKKNGN